MFSYGYRLISRHTLYTWSTVYAIVHTQILCTTYIFKVCSVCELTMFYVATVGVAGLDIQSIIRDLCNLSLSQYHTCKMKSTPETPT